MGVESGAYRLLSDETHVPADYNVQQDKLKQAKEATLVETIVNRHGLMVVMGE